jgi:plasmid stability protein
MIGLPSMLAVLALTALLALTAIVRYTSSMATITIRNLDDKVKRQLQVRAALNGRSMEAEARETLSGLLTQSDSPSKEGLETRIKKQFSKFGGVKLEIPPRQFSRDTASEELKQGLGTAIHNLFAPLGGVDLPIRPRRNSQRQIPEFE